MRVLSGSAASERPAFGGAALPAGIYHMTAGGQTSWFGFAQTILRNAAISTPVAPIRSDQYPAKVTRPRNSVLDNSRLEGAFGMTLPDWENQLEQVMAEILR